MSGRYRPRGAESELSLERREGITVKSGWNAVSEGDAAGGRDAQRLQ